jgi:hypothetical protein
LAKINQELIDRIADKLGITAKAIYPHIQKIVQETLLERDLAALVLNPYEWEHALREARGNNPYVGDVLDEVMEKAQAVVVMFSPDGLVHLKEHLCTSNDGPNERKPQGQARPNVLFEAGLAMGRHPDKTVLVQVGRVKAFSDVGGRHIARLTDDTESRNDLANRLEKIGCEVNRVGRDWMKAGEFVPTEPKRPKRKPAK